jgi:hypothetical protein
MAAIADALDAADLLERLLDTIDRAGRLLGTGDLAEAETALVRSIAAESEKIIALLEDVLDGQEAADALTEAEHELPIPWESIRDQFTA